MVFAYRYIIIKYNICIIIDRKNGIPTHTEYVGTNMRFNVLLHTRHNYHTIDCERSFTCTCNTLVFFIYSFKKIMDSTEQVLKNLDTFSMDSLGSSK